MRDLSKLTAKKILAIKKPELLFSQDSKTAKSEYRFLVKMWHPDFSSSTGAPQVITHIVKLYSFAREKSRNGTWQEPAQKIEEELSGIKNFRLTDGCIKTFEFRKIQEFELGRIFISDNAVLYEIDSEFEDLYKKGRRQIRSLTFENIEMACELSRCLPEIKDTFQTVDSCCLEIGKTPDQLLLRDILLYSGGKLAPVEHLGWILNCLYNICCYLQWAKITHNAINLDTVLVSPLRHSAMLAGGWWYSSKTGEKLIALPDSTIKVIPPDILNTANTDRRIDLELVKQVGRELAGDPEGFNLQFQKDIPQPVSDWLCMPASEDAIKDYAFWKYTVLEEAFGKPEFVNMEIESSEIYTLLNKED